MSNEGNEASFIHNDYMNLNRCVIIFVCLKKSLDKDNFWTAYVKNNVRFTLVSHFLTKYDEFVAFMLLQPFVWWISHMFSLI